MTISILIPEKTQTHWQARLDLGFKQYVHDESCKTIMHHRQHSGPLRVQKALWPNPNSGECHVIIIHPPAGIATGDQLAINIDVEQNSHAVLTTPGAGKWYGTAGAARNKTKAAQQNIKLNVQSGALLEWIPQEVMLFNGAKAQSKLQVVLQPNASFMGWDILVLGRQASNELFEQGFYHNHVQIYNQITNRKNLLIDDSLKLEGGDAWLSSVFGMNKQKVLGTFWAYPPTIYHNNILDEHINQCRMLIERMQMPLYVTRLERCLVFRYLGNNASHALDGFAAMRAKLRKLWFNLDETYPRIWRT